MAKQLSEMEQLEAFFKFETLPKTIRLDSGTIVPDVEAFMKLNMDRLRDSDLANPVNAGRLDRLRKLKGLLANA
jgi:hypothetical protein